MNLFDKYRRFMLAILPVVLAVVQAFAQGGSVVIEGNVANLSIVQQPGDTYHWIIYTDFNNKVEATPAEAEFMAGKDGASVPVLWKKPGDYFCSVTAYNLNGCMNMKVGMLKVISIPLQAMAGNDTLIGVCVSATLDASRSIGEGLTYQWRSLDIGGVLSQQNQAVAHFMLSPSYKGPLPADFDIELTVTDNKGNIDRDTLVVTITSAPLASLTHADELNNDGSMEVDGSVSLGMGLSYYWYTQEGQVIGANKEPKALIKGKGTYYLEVTDLFGCKSVKEFRFPFEDHVLVAYNDYARTSWVDAIDIPVLHNDYDSSNDIKLNTLRIVKDPTMGGVLVNPDGTVTYSPIVRKAGRDQFIYEICDSINLCDTALVTVDLYDGPIWIPEAISPNGDGSNETFVIRGLDAYPNSELTIYTRSGQLIYKNPNYLNDWDGRAMGSRIEDGTLLPTGTYYYVLHLGGTNRYLKGFIYVAY
jgi:gliding motility-associated-like protein